MHQRIRLIERQRIALVGAQQRHLIYQPKGEVS